VIDAILGAAGAGDVGSHFPPTDASWKDADSIRLLEKAAAVLRERGHEVINVDVTVVCETPKIRPYSTDMAGRLAAAMTISPDRVSVKGKTNEGLGWIGAGEGLAVHAVALID
jgi:2-C-methyl-D-erythritol 4-phosphate cytidylyltransferase/2-C-methyl-D-erythritol 2,4-cyclodiphosphate synthase